METREHRNVGTAGQAAPTDGQKGTLGTPATQGRLKRQALGRGSEGHPGSKAMSIQELLRDRGPRVLAQGCVRRPPQHEAPSQENLQHV